MKKILLYSLLSFSLFTGCKKDETLVDGQRPEERITEAVTKYSNTLTGSTYGWKAFLYPDGGGGYSFYLNFNKENKVTMYADLDYDPAQKSMESTYKVRALQNPTLSFDTYNYMHILADPNPSTFGGVAGWGVYSDFEFSIDKETGDTIKLTGKLLGSKLVLVKATQAEKTSYDSKGLYNSINTTVNYTTANKNLYVLLGDATKVQTTIDVFNKIFSLTWEDNGDVKTTSTGFAFTLTGIVLKEPLFYKGKKITELTWDPVKGVYYTTVDGVRVEVIISATPILPLHLLIGINYTTITAPNGTTYPGWSADFQTRRASAAAAMLAGPYGLRLDKMTFKFNTIQKTMVLTVDIYQGATRFVGDFPYTYTKTTAGVYKFTAGAPTGNAALIVANMAPLTTQRLDVNQFTLDYFTHPTTGAVLGQFKSVENPGFTFTGTLQ
ncbi:DUF4302 domain-containing protein [Pedobacter punctiformis]|uniref:DUF4302 domain-containing protein n=1 Tax=Pedobacter punctiformis TaxID=3004097 RepID=A0ABT4LBE5_9SPHI|nr:DUF4302 domain-containing protein [Pedobacter sp. HCMS5-2]MCZ4245224.1 DUF4302 domain-containing protein [Pedobacter sp. HCMS5-2]